MGLVDAHIGELVTLQEELQAYLYYTITLREFFNRDLSQTALEAAEKEADQIGLRESPHWKEFALKYIEQHRKR